jgi:hypothetical protein
LALSVAACGSQPTGETQQYRDYNPADANTQDSPDGQSLDCVPNLDGTLASSEFEPVLGVEARYVVSPPNETRQVDLAGQETPTGDRRWDWSYETSSSRQIQIAAEPIDDQWYADRFPDDAFALPFRLSGSKEGVYRKTDDQMLLLGLVSSEENPSEGKTRLVYREPVVVYKFPLEVGDEWVSKGEVRNGVFEGQKPYSGSDLYEIEVRAKGEMKLPNFTFDEVFRVDTKVTARADAGGTVRRRQVSFLAECFGEVARARSSDGVTKANFEEAAQVRRLGTRR